METEKIEWGCTDCNIGRSEEAVYFKSSNSAMTHLNNLNIRSSSTDLKFNLRLQNEIHIGENPIPSNTLIKRKKS